MTLNCAAAIQACTHTHIWTNMHTHVTLMRLVTLQVIWCLERCITCSVCAARARPSVPLAQPISCQCPGPQTPFEHSTTSCPAHRWSHWKIPTWSLRPWHWSERGATSWLWGVKTNNSVSTYWLFFSELSTAFQSSSVGWVWVMTAEQTRFTDLWTWAFVLLHIFL